MEKVRGWIKTKPGRKRAAAATASGGCDCGGGLVTTAWVWRGSVGPGY